MNHRTVVVFLFVFLCFGLGSGLTTTPSLKNSPNFLIIVTDDQRQDTFTPFFMPNTYLQLVYEGVRFENAFVTTPLCCPSRASIFTGTLARRHGILRNNTDSEKVPFADMNHFPEDLRNHGYYTGLVGKFLNSWTKGYKGRRKREFDYWASVGPLTQGSDIYYNFKIKTNNDTEIYQCAEAPSENCRYNTDELVRHALLFLEKALASDRPFLLYFAPNAPHGPATPAWRHRDLYTGILPYRAPSFAETDVSDKPFWLQNAPWIHRDEQGNRLLTEGEIEGLDLRRLDQLRSLAAIDEGIDAMLNYLHGTGQLRNTFVLFMSDNGHYWGEHYLKGKNAPYEESIAVPFAIRYPPLLPTRQWRHARKELVANIDVAPTIYELAGLTVPPQVQGKSLVSLLKRKTGGWRKSLFFEGWPDRPGDIGDPNQCRPPYRAIRDKRYIYVEYQTNTGTGVPCHFTKSDKPELYDLIRDPYQLENLAEDPSYSQIRSELKKQLDQFPKVDAPVTGKEVLVD